jgi:hypothetical protein
MATTIRPEISEKNKYWIDKHRHYELKHFCLQYPQWKKEYNSYTNIGPNLSSFEQIYSGSMKSDSTANWAIKRAYYKEKIDLIEKVAEETDYILYKYILKAVTEGLSYTYLKNILHIPCSRSYYYEVYRRFFWILDSIRD